MTLDKSDSDAMAAESDAAFLAGLISAYYVFCLSRLLASLTESGVAVRFSSACRVRVGGR